MSETTKGEAGGWALVGAIGGGAIGSYIGKAWGVAISLIGGAIGAGITGIITYFALAPSKQNKTENQIDALNAASPEERKADLQGVAANAVAAAEERKKDWQAAHAKEKETLAAAER